MHAIRSTEPAARMGGQQGNPSPSAERSVVVAPQAIDVRKPSPPPAMVAGFSCSAPAPGCPWQSPAADGIGAPGGHHEDVASSGQGPAATPSRNGRALLRGEVARPPTCSPLVRREAVRPSRSTTPSTACPTGGGGARVEAGPEDFRFAIKASRRITHIQAAQAGSERKTTSATCSILGEGSPKRGPVLFQLPPNLKKDLARLQRGPAAAARRPARRARVPARELVRRRGLRALCWRAGEVALCISDEGEDSGPTPLVATARCGYLRLRRETYAEEELAQSSARVAATQWRRPTRTSSTSRRRRATRRRCCAWMQL